MKLIRSFCSVTAFTLTLCLVANANAMNQKEQTPEQSKVKVEFIEAESYTDIRPSNESRSRYRERVLTSIESYFTELSEALPEGQSLDIKVTDIDLAGDTRSPRIPIGSAMFDVRVMEDIYFPRIKFSYELKSAAGEVLKAEEVNLRDMSYLNRAGVIARNRDAFPYEHFMLKQWFDETFG